MLNWFRWLDPLPLTVIAVSRHSPMTWPFGLESSLPLPYSAASAANYSSGEPAQSEAVSAPSHSITALWRLLRSLFFCLEQSSASLRAGSLTI